MLANNPRLFGRRRRGVVLVLILAMLGLLAVVGVTFATFSGQAQVGARYFSQSIADPDSDQLMDFALDQLINDTNNPASAIRGHSLKRDMYGNDGIGNGYLPTLPDGSPIVVTGVQGTAQRFVISTNIPAHGIPSLFGQTFGPIGGSLAYAWFARIELWQYDSSGNTAPFRVSSYTDTSTNSIHSALPQTFQIINDNMSTGFHTFALSPSDTTSTNNFYNKQAGGSYTGFGLLQPNASPATSGTITYQLQLVLDNRYRNAFNGSGAGNQAYFANYRLNGGIQQGFNSVIALGDPTVDLMDEDYDAVDLDNWFLAMQSADGQVMIPSFHRPGILQVDYNASTPLDDWRSFTPGSMSKFLRPRAIDHPLSGNSFPDLKPDPNTGLITYDVDNDGDGVNDSVWLDLGYPIQRDATGRMFKPLFAFMVQGLNGKIPLNTAGNLQALGTTNNTYSNNHTSHLGFSPSEINPKFALQNEPSGGQVATNQSGLTTFPTPNPNIDAYGSDVSLTQLRNILAGTRPQLNPIVAPNQPPNGTLPGSDQGTNGDTNWIITGGTQMWMPDGMYQATDGFPYAGGSGGGTPVYRGTGAIAGRWGESSGVPISPGVQSNGSYVPNVWDNPIRAGQSLPEQDTKGNLWNVDGRDDNFTSLDAYPFGNNTNPEVADYFDLSGSYSLPSERTRRFVTPIDPTGTGTVMTYNYAPASSFDFGYGGDYFGRVNFFHYFRPPGVPIDYSLSTPAPVIPDTYNNRYHGYESQRVPNVLTTNSATLPTQVAGMPFDLSNTTMPNPPSQAGLTPTFDVWVNSHGRYAGGAGTQNGFGSHSPMLNEADELALYSPVPQFDSPYGPHDLEWLYRDHDVDGSTLDSRLSQLAPVSLTNNTDGGMRRRMLTTDTWDLNNFTKSFSTHSNLTFVDYSGNKTDRGSTDSNTLIGIPTAQTGLSVAHRDRRINLNFPLPVSNDPNEPVRHKWVRETYQLLKQILPTAATDTAEKLAQLSQFVVNIVDFRDPDCAMTRFVNTDIIYTVASTTGQATLAINPNTSAIIPYDPTITDYNPAAKTHFLVQYGMEYNPIAINEVLAYQYQYLNNGSQVNQSRMWVELVNTLTQDGNLTSSPSGTLASDLGLANWDMVVMNDDSTGRPDPYTGGLPPVANPKTDYSFAPNPLPLTSLPSVPALAATGDTRTGTSNNYYVLASAGPANNQEPKASGSQGQLPAILPTVGLPAKASGLSNVYWLYLRRPADPTATYTPNPKDPGFNDGMVVVDSLRFVLSDAGITFTKDPVTGNWSGKPNAKPTQLYSIQRLQPYRGGQAVGLPVPLASTTQPPKNPPPPPPAPRTPQGGTHPNAPPPPPRPRRSTRAMATPSRRRRRPRPRTTLT
jgi:hypothetical protein